MSLDLSLIIPNKCRSIRNKEESMKCFNETVETITEYFLGRKHLITEITIRNESDEDIEYSFEIPILNITAYMRSGYWDIWPVANYKQYFYSYKNDMYGKPRIWPREVCFNTLLAFGQKEGWICDEYHSWNSLLDGEYSTFEDWLAYGRDIEDRRVYEFDVNDFVGTDPSYQELADYRSKYHDNYKECFAVLDAIKKRYPQYEILSIFDPLPDYAFAAKGDDLYIINMNTGECLTDFPIDNCKANFNGAGIQVFKGNESAFYSIEGEQLTEYRIGDFSWEWDKRECNFLGQIIKDHATGKKFLTDGTSYSEY